MSIETTHVWFTEKWKVLMILFSLFPLFVSIYGRRYQNSPFWIYLLANALLGILFPIFLSSDEKMAIGLPAILFGVFAFKAQQSLTLYMTNNPE